MNSYRDYLLDPRDAAILELAPKRQSDRTIVAIDCEQFIRYLPPGGVVQLASWAPHPDDVSDACTIDLESITDNQFVSARLSGGEVGTTARYGVRVQTDQGSDETVWFALPVVADLPA